MKRKYPLASLSAWFGFALGLVSRHTQPATSAMRRRVQKTAVALITIISATASFSHAKHISVSPEKCVIVLPAPAKDAKPPAVLAAQVRKTAAEELRKHLQLISGQEIVSVTQGKPLTGKYALHVGIPAPGDNKPLAPEEARWVVTAQGAYFYGEGNAAAQVAIYGFLEDQMGVRWIEPGDRGIAYRKQSPLALTEGTFSWAPALRMRKIRIRDRVVKELPQFPVRSDLALFNNFRRTLDENNIDAVEGSQWQDRMRMGAHDAPRYGHAFTKWWDKYGESHPEYFALTKAGKREPLQDPRPEGPKPKDSRFTVRERSFVKLCVSNPNVAQQIVEDWRSEKDRSTYLGASENDLGGFCECRECRKLDAPLSGERDLQHLSDRYVYLTNAVAREARKHKPDVRVVMYAYGPSESPPRRERIEPNVTVAIVPTTFDFTKLQALISGWKAAGATEFLIRPNYHWYYTNLSLPMGFEKHWFDIVQLSIRNGAVGFDFDSIKRNWPTTGMANYVLAKTMADPGQSYQSLEQHYLAAYGEAAPEVADYYRYWRTELWEKRLHPAMGTILQGRDAKFSRALIKQLDKHYKKTDFDRTDAILAAAARKSLDAPARAKLDRLILSNRHARLTFNAIATPLPEKLDHARQLLAFRQQHENDLSITWIDVIAVELNDVDTGMPAVLKRSGP